MKTLFLVTLFFLFLNTFVFAQEALLLNSKAPLFSVKDNKGEQINLFELSKKGPVVLVFYRGEWCPHCNLYMSDLQDSLKYISDAGATLVAITPESFDNIEKTVEKSKASFHIIYDKNHKIMDDYKVSYKLGGTKNLVYNIAGININKASGNDDRILPVPATYIINQNQEIIALHFDKDYTERMPVKDILSVLEAQK